MKQKFRLTKDNDRWRIHTKSKFFFDTWHKVDYFFSEDEARRVYAEIVKGKGYPIIIEESEWL